MSSEMGGTGALHVLLCLPAVGLTGSPQERGDMDPFPKHLWSRLGR